MQPTLFGGGWFAATSRCTWFAESRSERLEHRCEPLYCFGFTADHLVAAAKAQLKK